LSRSNFTKLDRIEILLIPRGHRPRKLWQQKGRVLIIEIVVDRSVHLGQLLHTSCFSLQLRLFLSNFHQNDVLGDRYRRLWLDGLPEDLAPVALVLLFIVLDKAARVIIVAEGFQAGWSVRANGLASCLSLKRSRRESLLLLAAKLISVADNALFHLLLSSFNRVGSFLTVHKVSDHI
jgi:hypothetical protein